MARSTNNKRKKPKAKVVEIKPDAASKEYAQGAFKKLASGSSNFATGIIEMASGLLRLVIFLIKNAYLGWQELFDKFEAKSKSKSKEKTKGK